MAFSGEDSTTCATRPQTKALHICSRQTATSTTNGTRPEDLTPSEQRIVAAVTRVMDAKLAIMRRVLEAREDARIDERLASLREEIDEAIMEAEDAWAGDGPDEAASDGVEGVRVLEGSL